MATPPRSRRRPTSTPSPTWEKTGIDRLYKRVGKRKVSWIYKHPDGRSETLASCPIGDRAGLRDAWRLAQITAADRLQGRIVANSVGEMIERFEIEEAPTHYLDQSKDGVANRKAMLSVLTAFFGKMSPAKLKTLHGYQFLDARAKAGAPARANKELALMSTICHYGVRWGLVERNPFTDMTRNVTESQVRTIVRQQVVRFYLWSVKQRQNYRTMGCAAMFTYLTGFRAAEVRPFLRSGIGDDGVSVESAKRKKGQARVQKLREWSPRLRCVVARAQQRDGVVRSIYLFAPTKRTACYSKSGWSSSWQDAMNAWIRTLDRNVKEGDLVTHHPLYFALQDIRPAAITTKLTERSADVYDFAAHADPSTTHKNYDRRMVKRAAATE
jgi:integrase